MNTDKGEQKFLFRIKEIIFQLESIQTLERVYNHYYFMISEREKHEYKCKKENE